VPAAAVGAFDPGDDRWREQVVWAATNVDGEADVGDGRKLVSFDETDQFSSVVHS